MSIIHVSNLSKSYKILLKDPFASILGLGSLLTKNAQLELEQKMLCNIALSLLHRLPIVHLDEPMVGLDIVVKKSIRDFFFHINREHGVSIILTSHDLEDVEKLCLRIIVIDKGQVLFDDSLEKIKNITARRGPWLWN